MNLKQTISIFSLIILLMVAFDSKAQTTTEKKDSISLKFKKMNNQNFTATILVEAAPKQVFDAVINPRGWWSEDIEGGTSKLNDEFLYRYKDVHIAKMKLTEVIPNKKVVWHVADNYFNFTKDKKEWTGNDISFEISEKEGKTQLKFTQVGLTPLEECYEVCNAGWTNYINNSLFNLITTGKGQPNPKEGGFNEQQVKKFKLKEQ